MDFKKIILYIATAVLGAALWHAWQHDYPSQPLTTQAAAVTQQQAPASSHSTNATPAPFDSTTISSTTQKKTAQTVNTILPRSQSSVEIKTDVLHAWINLQGAAITQASLPRYPVSLKAKGTPIQILSPQQDAIYIAQSGVTTGKKQGAIVYSASQKKYQLTAGQKSLTVRLTGYSKDGLKVIKTFTFKPGQYAVNVTTQLTNQRKGYWKGSLYNQFMRRNIPGETKLHSRTYNGAALSSQSIPYQQVSFKKLAEKDISQNTLNGWVAMQQPYFLSAWVPKNNQVNHYYSTSQGNGDNGAYNVFTLGYVSPAISLKAGQSYTSNSVLYIGPELADQLQAVAPHLDLTINYGFLAPISMLIFWIMKHINSIVGNWGWSIVLVTISIKIIFYPLSAKSLNSMAKMRLLQPKVEALKSRHGDDKQALGKATMELYRKEKANPMGGCLPMIIQIPVFFGLYYVLIESIQLRQAPFMLWVQDLSLKDPYYILPILMGISMFIQQRMNPPPADPTQAKVMMFLPVIFTVFFLHFPAGLVLYWLTNNCVQSLHQWYVLKTYDPKKEQYKKRQSKKSK